MKKILIIQTGGTIGSVERDGVISAEADPELIRRICGGSLIDYNIEVIQPLNILSENLCTRHWEILSEALSQINTEDICGIIMTHGSDTLSYTSAFLGKVISSPIPVIITAANFVPDDPRSNAESNLRAAIRLIREGIAGVWTVYQNPGEDFVSVFLPDRITEADRFMDRFSCADGFPAAIVGGDKIIWHNKPETKTAEYKGRLCRSIHFHRNVLVLQACPSFPYDAVAIAENTGAVILTTYHSGTVPESVAVIAEKCRSRKIPVYLCSLKSPEGSVYETTDAMLRGGFIPLYGMTTEAAFAKLLTELCV